MVAVIIPSILQDWSRESHIIYSNNALRHTSRHIQVYVVLVVIDSVAVYIEEAHLCSICGRSKEAR